MTEKIKIVGTKAERINDVGRTAPRVTPEEFASALGAEPLGERLDGDRDPISLAALGNELIKRLRSTGGRPALADATKSCKVPMSVEDVDTLEQIVAAVAQATGVRPSSGQIASVILRMHLDALKRETGAEARDEQSKMEKPASLPQMLQTSQLLAACKELIKEELQPLRRDIDRLMRTAQNGV